MSRRLPLSLFAAVLAVASVALGGRPANYTYVQSGPGGIFYARATPAAGAGTAGRTEVFRVDAAADVPLDRYDWYAPGGITLGWSPLAGKIAVLSAMQVERGTQWRTQEELRFSIGGKLLASWTNEQLIERGARTVVSSHGGQHANYRIVGCEQVPGTAEYDFVVVLDGAREIRFDVLTGQPRVATTRPAS